MKPRGDDEKRGPDWIQTERERRADVKTRYGALFDEVSAILFDVDPIGINFDDNTDEYDPEAGTILPRLDSCTSAESVRVVVHEEFVRWFGPESKSEMSYQPAAERIWDAWTRYKASR